MIQKLRLNKLFIANLIDLLFRLVSLIGFDQVRLLTTFSLNIKWNTWINFAQQKNCKRIQADCIGTKFKIFEDKINVLKKQMNGKARMGSENQLSAATSSTFFDTDNHAHKLIASWF